MDNINTLIDRYGIHSVTSTIVNCSLSHIGNKCLYTVIVGFHYLKQRTSPNRCCLKSAQGYKEGSIEQTSVILSNPIKAKNKDPYGNYVLSVNKYFLLAVNNLLLNSS